MGGHKRAIVEIVQKLSKDWMKPELIQNTNYSDTSCYGRAKVPHITLILSWGSFMLHKNHTPATEYAAAFKLSLSQTSAPGQIIYSFIKIYTLPSL